MKIYKYLILSLTLIGFFCLSIFDFDMQQKKIPYTFYKEKQNYISLEKVKFSENELKTLLNIAQATNIILSTSQNEMIEGNDYQIYFTSFTNLEDYEKYLNKLNIKEDTDRILPNNNKNCSEYKEFLDNDKIGYSLLSYFWSQNDFRSIIVVHFNQDWEYESFINTLEEELNISREDLEVNNIEMIDDSQKIISFIKIFYCCFSMILIIVVGLILSYEMVKSSKEIAIKKLNGYGNLKLFFQKIKPTIILFIIMILVLFLVSIFIFSNHQFMIKFVLEMSLFMLFEFIILSVIYFILLKNISLSEILKQKKIFTKVAFFTYILEFVLLVLISFSFVIGITTYQDYNTKLKEKENFSKYSNLMSFDTYRNGYSSQQLREWNEYLFEYWQQNNNGLYCNFEQQYAILNINYIHYYKNLFEGLTFESDYIKESNYIFILIPENLEDKYESINNTIEDEYDINEENIKFIEYQHVTLPTLQYNDKGDGNYSVSDPVIIVLNDYFYNLRGSLYFDAFGTDKSLKFDPETLSKQEIYTQLIENVEIESLGNVLKIGNLNRIDYLISEKIASQRFGMSVALIGCIISFFFYALLQFATLRILVEDDKKEIAIKELYGYSFFEIIKTFLYTNILHLLAGSLLVIIVLSLILDYSFVISFFTTLGFSIISLLLLVVFGHMIMHQRIVHVLKGE